MEEAQRVSEKGAELAVPSVPDWDFPRSVASILLMVRFAEERGVPVARSLRGSSLAGRDLTDPDRQVDARQELTVVRNLAGALCVASDSDAVPLALGRRYHVTTFGIFGFACISSPTLRDAMSFALRYLDLSFTFCIPRVAVGGDTITLTMDDARVPDDVARFLVLRDLAAIYTVMLDLGPRIPLRTMAFRHDEPADVEDRKAYLDVFGNRPSFGRPEHVVTLDREYLDRPLPQANEHTVRMCEAQCRELVTRRRARSGISHEVRGRLVRVGGADTGMDAVARDLNMSPRTLRRRLEAAGTSYRALVDEVREALAEEMLNTGAMSVEDVAIRLGYAEASSFIYAFKRWKGITPAAYARRAAGSAASG